MNPQWLAKVGIGTLKESEDYIKGDHKDWLRNPPGQTHPRRDPGLPAERAGHAPGGRPPRSPRTTPSAVS